MAVNKVVINRDGTEEILVDLTADTINADALTVGYTAHSKTGAAVNGKNPYARAETEATVDTQAELIYQITATLAGKTGGLFDGTTAIKTGTFYQDSDQDADIVVPHGLGVKPSFYFLVACDDFVVADESKGIYSLVFIVKPYTQNATTYEGRGQITYATTSGSMSHVASSYPNCTDEYFKVTRSSAYVLKGGTTYLWVAGKIDGMV